MPNLLANRYELAEPLGVGGSARVVAARDRLLDRRVAVKLLGRVDDQRQRELLAEARAAARVSHPRVVGVYDVGEEDDRPFVVMELVAGETLAERLARVGPLGPRAAADVGHAVLTALDAAHAAGLVHRDVKPGNVLLPSGSPPSEAKLADFGIAKDRGEVGITQTGEVLGTPAYLSPEQINGQEATPATDLYAVGVLLFETLSGQPPYAGATPLATALRHRDAPVPSLRAAAPGVPDELAALVEQALAKDPAHRPRAAEDMRLQLARAVGADADIATTSGTMPATSTSAAASGGSALRQARPAVLVALFALVTLLGVWLLPGDGGLADQGPGADQPPGADAGTTAEGVPEAAGDAVEPPPPASDTPPPGTAVPEAGAGLPELNEPDDAIAALTELVDVLADPEPADVAADAVRDDIVDLLGEADAGERAADARELLVELTERRAAGELARDTTARVAAALAPVARPDDPAVASLGRALPALAVVAQDAGSGAPDLAEELADLLSPDAGERAEDARDVLADMGEAVSERELDADVVAPLGSILERLAGS